MFKCQLCGREFAKLKGLARHIVASHDISPQEYYDKYTKKDEEGICKNCGKPTYFQNFTLGYSEFCNKVCKCEFKYGKGITHPMTFKEVQAKVEATNEKRYGSKNIRSSKYFKDKMTKHFQEKYGVDNPLQAEEVKEKIKQTNLDKYGAENVFASDYGKNKIKETMLNKYGVEHALQDKKLLDKAQSTTLDRFGTLHAAQNDKIKEKMKSTKIKNDEIFCKENNCTSIQDLNLKYPRLSVQEGNIETTYARRFIYANNNDIDTLLKIDKRLQEEENQYNSIFEKEISNWLVNDLKIEYKSNGFGVTSNGEILSSHRYFRENQSKLAMEQRRLSHKKKGPKNYEKQRLKITKVHEYIANCRKDRAHKLSYYFAENFDVVCLEDLNLQSIAQSLRLGKSTNDNGFGMFRNFLAYKMQDRGKYLIYIDKWDATSTVCSACGSYHKDIVNSLLIREWTCPDCGTYHDRDINAAKNILRLGLEKL